MAWTYYLAPTAQGTGDGSSAANAASASGAKIVAKLREWNTALKASPKERGLNVAWSHPVMTGGTLNGQPASASNPIVPGKVVEGDKILQVKNAHAVLAGRIMLRSDLGRYNTGSTLWCTMTADCSGIFGEGTSESPHRMLWIGACNSSGVPMNDNGGIVETTSTPVSAKAGTAADWANSANYDTTTGNWKGSIVTKNHVVDCQLPATGRAVIVGTRDTDKRPNRKDYQLIVNGSNRAMYNPNSTAANPIYLQADGETPYLGDQGDMFHMPTKTWVDRNGDSGFSLGGSCFKLGSSLIVFQGLEFRQWKAPFDLSQKIAHSFVQFKDIYTDNTTYVIWPEAQSRSAGINARDYYLERVENVAWSNKAYGMGGGCYRWYVHNIRQRGEFVVGDSYKCGFSAVGPHDAGPLFIENFVGTDYWDAIPVLRSDGTYDLGKYFQGECADYECYNLQVINFKIDLCGDGGFDTKARTRWRGYAPIYQANGLITRAKRADRLWYPEDDLPDGAQNRFNKSVLRDVTLQDIRQIGIYAPTNANHHRIVDWDNSRSGFANFDYRLFTSKEWEAIRHEADVPTQGSRGNITVLMWQMLDRRIAGSTAVNAINNSVTGLPVIEPFRKQVRILRNPRPKTHFLMAVNGVTHDPDSAAPIPLADTANLSIPGMAGMARVYSNKADAVLTVSGEGATFKRRNPQIDFDQIDLMPWLMHVESQTITNVTDGSPLLIWPGGAGRVIQPTSAERPVFRTTGTLLANSHPAVQFDGVDDNFDLPSISTNRAQTLFAVVRSDAWSATDILLGCDSTKGGLTLSVTGTGTKVTLSSEGVGTIGSTATIPKLTGYNVIAASYANPGAWYISVSTANDTNGTAGYTASGTSTVVLYDPDLGSVRRRIGAGVTGYYFAGGIVAAFQSSRVLTVTQRDLVIKGLLQKYVLPPA
ncbi:hypothetical protein CYG49_05080 [Candidatus Saccharibacteria bacterium]|nr:MAG: hypothetical protein CYG49_05080 [Candidatus Saccharibacteria bacterium]